MAQRKSGAKSTNRTGYSFTMHGLADGGFAEVEGPDGFHGEDSFRFRRFVGARLTPETSVRETLSFFQRREQGYRTKECEITLCAWREAPRRRRGIAAVGGRASRCRFRGRSLQHPQRHRRRDALHRCTDDGSPAHRQPLFPSFVSAVPSSRRSTPDAS